MPLRKLKPRLLAAAWVAVAALAGPPAQAADNRTGSQASAGGLTVMQIATTDPKTLMESWEQEGEGVRIAAASTMRRNQPIATFILFSGCRPDADGQCNVTVDFEALTPSGAVYERLEGAKVWVGRPAPPARSIGLSEGGLGLRIEDKDPLGAYVVRATVFDHNSGIKLQTSQTLTATN